MQGRSDAIAPVLVIPVILFRLDLALARTISCVLPWPEQVHVKCDASESDLIFEISLHFVH